MKNWYALYTRPHWEKKVIDSLTENDYECYCPVNKVFTYWSDRKKIVLKPLFTSYVFIRCTEQELTKMRDIDGVIYYVSWNREPAVIRESDIEAIRKFLNEHNILRISEVPLKLNDKVKIKNGPLQEREGCVVKVGLNKVKVMLPSLGYAIIAEIAKDNLHVLEEEKA